MALSTIDRVKAAEIAANEAREKAELESASIIEDAKRKADAVIAEAKANVELDDQQQAAIAKKKADELIAARRKAAQEEADALRVKTMQLRQNVINKLILETLV